MKKKLSVLSFVFVFQSVPIKISKVTSKWTRKVLTEKHPLLHNWHLQAQLKFAATNMIERGAFRRNILYQMKERFSHFATLTRDMFEYR